MIEESQPGANWEQVKEQLSGQSVLLAIDVAKDEQYGVLSSSDLGDAVLRCCCVGTGWTKRWG